jgi:NADPH2:quinone reductase
MARPEDLVLVPEAVDDVFAASLPVAYLTAQITLTLAGFKPGMRCWLRGSAGRSATRPISSRGRRAPAK